MVDYDKLEERVRALEIWRAENGSVKGDLKSLLEDYTEKIPKIIRHVDDYVEKMPKIMRHVEETAVRSKSVDDRIASIETRVSKNEETSSWIGGWKQRAQGITSTLAVLYVGIELMWPGSIARLFKALGSALSGGQP